MAELWARCRAVAEDPNACEWLQSRALNPDAIDDADLARLAPTDGTLPRWAGHWRTFEVVLVLPLFDAFGELAGLQGRCPEGPRKSIRMRGVRCSGMVLCSPAARQILRLGQLTDDAQSPIEIVEGEMDLLSVLCRRPEAAVFGIPGEGAWTPELAARIPVGSEVHVATHQDPAGDAYAAVLNRTLHQRCHVLRARWTP